MMSVEFIFGDIMYKQTDGVSMSSPLGMRWRISLWIFAKMIYLVLKKKPKFIFVMFICFVSLIMRWKLALFTLRINDLL